MSSPAFTIQGMVFFACCASPLVSAAPAAHCSLAGAPAAHFALRAPFDVVDGRIYVQASVNGRGPFRFAVDTGASGVARADSSLTAALGLASSGAAHTSDGVQSAQVDTVRLDSLALGSMSVQNIDVIARDYGSRMAASAAFHGILARDFFADGLLILDYPGRTLSFSRTLSLPDTGGDVLDYERAFRVPVSLGAIETRGHLDTGANVSLVMPRALYDRVDRAPLTPAGQGTLGNTRIDTGLAVLKEPVTIGQASLSRVQARVSERFPELLVGAHILQQFTVMIDQRNRRVALCAARDTAMKDVGEDSGSVVRAE